MTYLLPCPFCGEDGASLVSGRSYVVKCESCWGIRTTEQSTPEDAAKIWNTRHPQNANPSLAEGYYLPKGHPDHPFTPEAPLYTPVPEQPVEKPQRERCIADDQWAIDAFYKGYDKANADFKANGYTGLKPVIGGIRSLVDACKPERV